MCGGAFLCLFFIFSFAGKNIGTEERTYRKRGKGASMFMPFIFLILTWMIYDVVCASRLMIGTKDRCTCEELLAWRPKFGIPVKNWILHTQTMKKRREKKNLSGHWRITCNSSPFKLLFIVGYHNKQSSCVCDKRRHKCI